MPIPNTCASSTRCACSRPRMSRTTPRCRRRGPRSANTCRTTTSIPCWTRRSAAPANCWAWSATNRSRARVCGRPRTRPSPPASATTWRWPTRSAAGAKPSSACATSNATTRRPNCRIASTCWKSRTRRCGRCMATSPGSPRSTSRSRRRRTKRATTASSSPRSPIACATCSAKARRWRGCAATVSCCCRIATCTRPRRSTLPNAASNSRTRAPPMPAPGT